MSEKELQAAQVHAQMLDPILCREVTAMADEIRRLRHGVAQVRQLARFDREPVLGYPGMHRDIVSATGSCMHATDVLAVLP